MPGHTHNPYPHAHMYCRACQEDKCHECNECHNDDCHEHMHCHPPKTCNKCHEDQDCPDHPCEELKSPWDAVSSTIAVCESSHYPVGSCIVVYGDAGRVVRKVTGHISDSALEVEPHYPTPDTPETAQVFSNAYVCLSPICPEEPPEIPEPPDDFEETPLSISNNNSSTTFLEVSQNPGDKAPQTVGITQTTECLLTKLQTCAPHRIIPAARPCPPGSPTPDYPSNNTPTIDVGTLQDMKDGYSADNTSGAVLTRRICFDVASGACGTPEFVDIVVSPCGFAPPGHFLQYQFPPVVGGDFCENFENVSEVEDSFTTSASRKHVVRAQVIGGQACIVMTVVLKTQTTDTNVGIGGVSQVDLSTEGWWFNNNARISRYYVAPTEDC